jgi:hypothetical protein
MLPEVAGKEQLLRARARVKIFDDVINISIACFGTGTCILVD